MRIQLALAGAKTAVWLRGGRGAVAAMRNAPPPNPRLILYEYEGSPWCRRVREHACSLDLPLRIRPCPREALFSHMGPPFQPEGFCGPLSRFRKEVKDRGGHLFFPFLVDESAGVAMNESSAIVRHLWQTYAGNVHPEWPRPTASYNLASLQDSQKMRTLEPGVCLAPGERWRAGEQEAIEREARIWQLLDVPTLVASSFMRPLPSHGVMLRPSRRRDACGELSLYGHEGCAQTRLVREALSSLQLAYTLVPFGTIGGTRTCPKAADVNGPVLVDGDKAVLLGAANATQYLDAEYSLGKSLHSDAVISASERLATSAPDSALIVSDDPLHEGRPGAFLFCGNQIKTLRLLSDSPRRSWVSSGWTLVFTRTSNADLLQTRWAQVQI